MNENVKKMDENVQKWTKTKRLITVQNINGGTNCAKKY